MATIYNTVKLKTYQAKPVNIELKAATSISPGMLVELNSSGNVTTHSSAEGNIAPIMFAMEDELQGKGLDADYNADDKVQVWIPQRGDEVLGILADGETVTIGDLLQSNGNGQLQQYSSVSGTDNSIVGQVLETLDLSGSSGEESSGIYGSVAVKVRIA